METISITTGIMTALITAITHLASETGLPTKACPWLALVLGVAGVYLVNGFNVATLFTGLIIGLMSYGLWNGALDVTGKQL